MHTGRAAMRYNLRHNNRYFLTGQARLESLNQVVEANLVDVSLGGIGLAIDSLWQSPANMRRTWLCTVSSPDLPQDIRCLVRMVRRNTARSSTVLGCLIVDIDDQNLALLKAFRALAMARGNPRRA